MLPYVFLIGGLIGIGVALWLPGYRLRRAVAADFPPAWERILITNLPPYRRMPVEWRERLQRLIQRFLYEKEFVGCAGQTIDDEVRVTIAASACLLVLNRPSTVYESLRFIYVYPSGFHAPTQQVDDAGVVTQNHQGRSGESWSNGKVILSWDDVTRGTRNFGDGHNVALHEFAHQLDQESGSSNGAPLLNHAAAYARWGEVFSEEFRELVHAAQHGHPKLLDHYGATNPAEFFAVTTEVFFEQPQAMAEHHRELYGLLCDYYALDPRDWH